MDFDYQPILRDKLVTLRPLRAEDYDTLYEVASDPAIWEQHPANRNEEAVFREFFKEALESGGTLVATDPEAGRVIGSSRFHGYDAKRREVEIGWTFLAAPENVRSQRAAEKVGAVRDGTRPDACGRLCYVYRIAAVARARGAGP